MKILDLYCKAGGASAGYARAGFEVVGVDIVDQPNYPYEFIKMDAIEFLKTQDISEYDAIHASPPCQAHTRAKHLSAARNGGKYRDHKDLIQATRELLQKTGKPYVIENVVGAPLIKPIARTSKRKRRRREMGSVRTDLFQYADPAASGE